LHVCIAGLVFEKIGVSKPFVKIFKYERFEFWIKESYFVLSNVVIDEVTLVFSTEVE
jgi:hypothetical protein